ncbi:MAG: hypothetical protein ABJL55_16405 [Roseibium sp.]
MAEFWAFLADESNQQTLTWLGGGLVVLGGALWTVVTFVWKPKKAGSGQSSGGAEVLADRGGLAAGGNISIDTSSKTTTGVSGPTVAAIVFAAFGAIFLAIAFAGNTVTATNGGVAAGGDISGSTITIIGNDAGDPQ